MERTVLALQLIWFGRGELSRPITEHFRELFIEELKQIRGKLVPPASWRPAYPRFPRFRQFTWFCFEFSLVLLDIFLRSDWPVYDYFGLGLENLRAHWNTSLHLTQSWKLFDNSSYLRLKRRMKMSQKRMPRRQCQNSSFHHGAFNIIIF